MSNEHEVRQQFGTRECMRFIQRN